MCTVMNGLLVELWHFGGIQSETLSVCIIHGIIHPAVSQCDFKKRPACLPTTDVRKAPRQTSEDLPAAPSCSPPGDLYALEILSRSLLSVHQRPSCLAFGSPGLARLRGGALDPDHVRCQTQEAFRPGQPDRQPGQTPRQRWWGEVRHGGRSAGECDRGAAARKLMVLGHASPTRCGAVHRHHTGATNS